MWNGRSLVARAIGWLVIAAAVPGCAAGGSGPQVRISQGRWQVELAVTNQQRYQGLSGRSSIPEGTGMLFVYPAARVRNYCMRGCPVPIDIAFIGADRRIVRTYTMAVEPDLAGRVVYSSGAPAQYVLEVAGGALAKAGVSVGDSVELPSALETVKADPGP
jgi:uncharacterized membrane protein (UPF0127 family)